MYDDSYSYIFGSCYTTYRQSDKLGKTLPSWNPDNAKNLLTSKNCRFDIRFPRAII